LQFDLSRAQVGDNIKYVKEGSTVEILFYNDEPIAVNLPFKVNLKITYTEPGIKGDTVSSPSKPAELETGAKVFVPLFIKTGDEIIIDTRTGVYIERVK